MSEPRLRLATLTLCAIATALPACSPGCFLKPNEPFKAASLAEPPNYTKPTSWAALPDAPARAAYTPPGAPPALADPRPADVFFVHPTTWFSKEVWNDTLTSASSREIVDHMVMAGSASAFNGCCRVYAPRYRQATLGAFYGEAGDAARAFAVAYEDVSRAFDVFLKAHSDGRPFIIAGHSQGSMHAMRLLERVDADPALRARLVAAYIPGFALPMSRYGARYKHLKPCETPEQTACIASWDTYQEGADVKGAEPLVFWEGDRVVKAPSGAPRQCTNPITWRADATPSPKKAHLGAAPVKNDGEPISFRKILFADGPLGLKVTGLQRPRAGLLSARCHGGALRVPDLDDLSYEAEETQSGNYHLLDYELFYMDIRHNAQARVKAWVKAHPTPTPTAAPTPTP